MDFMLLMLLVARRGDLAVSTRKITEDAAQVGAGPEREDQILKLGKVIPIGLAQRAGSGGKGSGRGVWWCGGIGKCFSCLLGRVGR